MQRPVDPPRRRGGPLLFVPGRVQRTAMLVTLKRVHAWTGLWGAALFLLMGTSGVLLNHRATLKITTAPVESSEVRLPVAAGVIGSEEALGSWAQRRLGLPVEGRPLPPAGGESSSFMGREVRSAVVWGRQFILPDQRLTVTHVPGSTSVEAKRDVQGLLGLMKNLHKGVGMGIAWVLLFDSIAGALIAMSITGFLLWSRLHGPRLLAGALAGGAAGWALIACAPFVGV